MGVVDEPITDSVGERGIADALVPVRNRKLPGEQRGSGPVPIIQELQISYTAAGVLAAAFFYAYGAMQL